MDASIQELNQKIDLLATQVAYLSEQAQIAERQRLERAELVRDLTPIADQAFTLAVTQLEEVQEYIDLADLLRLFKRLMRNGRNLEKMLDQLESLADLLQTVGPLADDAFGKAVDTLAGLEAKGYFAFARGGTRVMDGLVASLSEQELVQLGETLPRLISLVKEVAQPGVISFAEQTFADAKEELAKPVDTSYLGLLRQLRNPEVRRGLALTLSMLHVLGLQATSQIPSA
jgi:uncharacterized protein YjgD (DUF1641 family)